MNSIVYIKEIDKSVPFDRAEAYSLEDDRFNVVGYCIKLLGVPMWVNDEILRTGNGIVTCTLYNYTAAFYTAPGVLIEAYPMNLC